MKPSTYILPKGHLSLSSLENIKIEYSLMLSDPYYEWQLTARHILLYFKRKVTLMGF